MIEAARGRESVHVVNINHIVTFGQLDCVSSLLPFVFLSDHDVFVSTVSTWSQLTELEIDGCK